MSEGDNSAETQEKCILTVEICNVIISFEFTEVFLCHNKRQGNRRDKISKNFIPLFSKNYYIEKLHHRLGKRRR